MLFWSIIFAIFIICYLVSFGMLERFSIVMITLFIYIYINKMKKIDMKCHCIVFTGIILGIILCSYSLYFFEYKNDIKKEPSAMSENENTAVLLVFDGEPERYNLSILLKNMDTKDNLKNKIYAPFRLYQYKRAYEYIGISKYNDISKRLREKLLNHLDEGYDVYVAYLNNKPYYKETIYKRVIKENYSKVIVVPIFLTESMDYKRTVYTLEMENLYTSNGMLKVMSPLWDSEKIAKSIVKQACKINAKKNEIGIILIGRDAASMNEKNFDAKVMNQEQAFMEKTKTFLIENGFENRKIKFTGLDFHDLEIKNVIGELQQYGVGKILLIGVNDIIDKIENQYKLERLIEKLKSTEDIDIHYIKGWGESDLLIEELEFRIRLMNVEKWDQ